MLETTLNRRIAILVYEDLEAAFEYLIRVFGFGPGELMRDPDGNVVHAEIHAGDGEFWLHMESEPFGLRSPKHLGGASGTMAVMVDDVDAHHRYSSEQGATIRYEPVDQAYGYREYGAIDHRRPPVVLHEAPRLTRALAPERPQHRVTDRVSDRVRLLREAAHAPRREWSRARPSRRGIETGSIPACTRPSTGS